MDCDICKLHTRYLERIINIQKEEIEYLKSINNLSKTCSKGKETKEINYSVYDIIDHHIEQLNIQIFLQKIEAIYPAINSMNEIIQNLIIHDEYNLLNKEKANIIKYLNKDNQMVYENIEIFSSAICIYIFNKLKPIIENIFDENIDDDNEQCKENNRVRNIMLLKDNKFQINSIVKLLNRLN